MYFVSGEPRPTTTDDAIRGFFGEYRYLSNFHRAPVTIDGLTYPSSEHAFMAQKTLDVGIREKFTDKFMRCKDAKIKGREIELRPGWDEMRVQTMLDVVYAKFSQNPELKELLLGTGDKLLEETNYWKDTFWGVCNGVGTNHLGQCLMEVRARLRKEQSEA